MILVDPGRTPWDLKWTMFRMPVRIHPLFWLIALLLSYPFNVKDFPNESYPFGLVLVSIACIFVSILVHELGHALAQRYYGDPRPTIVLYSFGGLAIPSREAPGHWPQIVILLWGPFAGFILGGIAFGVLKGMESGAIPLPDIYVFHMLHSLVWINLVWGLVNFIPLIPLDGGHIMQEIIRWKWPSKGDVFAFQLSFYVGIVATVAALIAGVMRGIGLYPAIMAGFLTYGSYRAWKHLKEFGPMDDVVVRREPWEQDPDWWKSGR